MAHVSADTGIMTTRAALLAYAALLVVGTGAGALAVLVIDRVVGRVERRRR